MPEHCCCYPSITAKDLFIKFRTKENTVLLLCQFSTKFHEQDVTFRLTSVDVKIYFEPPAFKTERIFVLVFNLRGLNKSNKVLCYIAFMSNLKQKQNM